MPEKLAKKAPLFPSRFAKRILFEDDNALMPRFRIKTLLVFTAIVAVSVFLWMRYITPNVARVGIEGSYLVIHMTEAYALNAFHADPNNPFGPPIPGPAPPGASRLGDPFSVVSFVAFQIPLWVAGVLVGLALGIISVIWCCASWLLSWRKGSRTASPPA